jgi:hypothetical protein
VEASCHLAQQEVLVELSQKAKLPRQHCPTFGSCGVGVRKSTIGIKGTDSMTSKNDAPRKTVYRGSDDGKFVTKKYAETHPKTTEKERVRIDPPPSKRK